MSISVAFYGSIGVGTCTHPDHSPSIEQSGILLANASTVFSNGLKVGQLTNIVLGDDGHTGIIVSASNTVFANGLGVAFVGSTFAGDFNGVIVSGSSNVSTGL